MKSLIKSAATLLGFTLAITVVSATALALFVWVFITLLDSFGVT